MLFLGLAALSIRYRGREVSSRTKRLWLVVAIVSGALVIGSIQRLLVQASLLGWLPESFPPSATNDWQLAQSVIVAILAIIAFREIRKLADSFAITGRVAGSILDRVSHVEVDNLDLSPRESEVLEFIGSGLLSDAKLGGVRTWVRVPHRCWWPLSRRMGRTRRSHCVEWP